MGCRRIAGPLFAEPEMEPVDGARCGEGGAEKSQRSETP
jgi:hypothetical protein